MSIWRPISTTLSTTILAIAIIIQAFAVIEIKTNVKNIKERLILIEEKVFK